MSWRFFGWNLAAAWMAAAGTALTAIALSDWVQSLGRALLGKGVLP